VPDHAGVELDDVIEDCRSEIAQGGFTVAAIAGDGGGCDWAYTIGLHRSHGHAELLIVGLEAHLAGAVLHVLGARVAAGERLGPDPVRLEGGMELRARPVDDLWGARGDWFVLGRAVMDSWGERWPPTVQLTWPDASGNHPERPGDRRWMLRQPLLSAG
jgi:hypothetical protein